MADEASEKALQLAMAFLDKQYGKGSVMNMATHKPEPWPCFPTGALTLDIALGTGGLPMGRVVEIYGPESSGKTTLCLSLIVEAQRASDKNCLFIDAEHALDPVYAAAIGVDLSRLYIAQPDSGEKALSILDHLVSSGAFSIAIVDSVAALTPQAELDGEMDQQHMGQLPRLMSKAMRKLVSKIDDTNTLVVFTNQIREKIGVVYGNPETTPGGRGLKFAASVRINISRIKDIEKDGEKIGVRTKAKIIKNKMAPPYRVAEFDIMYGRGINHVGCILDTATEVGILKKNGNWYAYNGENLANGRDNTIAYLASDLEFTRKIEKEVHELL